ncbi:MAG: hypothetical protein KDD22_06985 [Bdellovibrionales bacterium]|nr:hypothetical protein [Bdellovibrionales bacterium]
MESKSLFRILFVFTLITPGLSSCSLLQRDPRSGYSNVGDYTQPGYEQLLVERAQHKTDLVYEELGWSPTKALTPEEAKTLEHRLRLKRLESTLATNREKRQYYQYKGGMVNDEERIYFLQLPTFEARERWAANRSLQTDNNGYSEIMAQIIEKNDIALGMTQKAVIESWGDPDAVEVAGNAVYGNERWRYSKYVPSNEGYQKVDRFLYFEAGRLIGWQTN